MFALLGVKNSKGMFAFAVVYGFVSGACEYSIVARFKLFKIKP